MSDFVIHSLIPPYSPKINWIQWKVFYLHPEKKYYWSCMKHTLYPYHIHMSLVFALIHLQRSFWVKEFVVWRIITQHLLYIVLVYCSPWRLSTLRSKEEWNVQFVKTHISQSMNEFTKYVFLLYFIIFVLIINFIILDLSFLCGYTICR